MWHGPGWWAHWKTFGKNDFYQSGIFGTKCPGVGPKGPIQGGIDQAGFPGTQDALTPYNALVNDGYISC